MQVLGDLHAEILAARSTVHGRDEPLVANALAHQWPARPRGCGATQAGESVHRGLAQVHAGELGGWTGGLGEALAHGVQVGVRLVQSRLDLAPVAGEEHGLEYGSDEQGDGRQRCQVSRRSFHDLLPGTVATG
jgi:hypothetical protein